MIVSIFIVTRNERYCEGDHIIPSASAYPSYEAATSAAQCLTQLHNGLRRTWEHTPIYRVHTIKLDLGEGVTELPACFEKYVSVDEHPGD